MLLLVLCYLAPLFLAILCYKKLNKLSRFRAAVSKYGCQRPRQYPHRDPIWGSDLAKQRKIAVQDGRQMELYMEHFNALGKTWEEKFYNKTFIHTMEMRNIQHVAAVSFKDYGKSATNINARFIGDGIFSQEGSAWRHSRDIIKPAFARSELSDVDSLEIHMERLLGLIPRDGTIIDMQAPLHKFFLDVSTEKVFGKSTESLLATTNDSTEFVKAFDEARVGIGKRRLAGVLAPVLYAFDSSFEKACDKVHSFVDLQVQRALELTESSNLKKNSEAEGNNRYVLLYEMAKHIRDPIKLRHQILNVFAPARDTTSILVANSLFHLARNPEIWTKLRTESLAIGDQGLTFACLKSLRTFKHVLAETIRVQGPASRVQRLAIRDNIIPTGGGPDGTAPVFVEKGTVLSLSVWGLHHDTDIWGEDAMEFKPERWIGRKTAWEFIPFFGGPRICPAQQQVLTQATYVLVRLTREFSMIHNKDPVLQYVELVKMTTESRNGIKVSFSV